MIKVITLDFDGVLTKGKFFSARLEQKYGIPPEKTVAVFKSQDWKDCQLGKKSIKDVWANFPKQNNLNISYKELINFWFQGEYIDKNILNLVDKLRKKVKVFLLTNNPRERVEYYNKEENLFNHFDKVIVSSDIGYFKTSQEASKLISNNPKEVLAIDNSEKDLAKYKANGFNTLLYEGIEKLEKDLGKYNLL